MLTLDVKITNRCNYRCEYCYGLPDNKEMNEDTYKKFVEIAKRLNFDVIEICGGEPLVHPEFERFTKLASDFKLILRTNGMLIEKYLDLISEYYSWVGVSLDGVQDVNHMMRKSGTNISARSKFETPINNIRKLKEKNPGIKILLGTLVSRLNYDRILELGDYIVENEVPVDIWKLYLFRGMGGRAKQNEKKFILSEEEFNKLTYDGIRTFFLQGYVGTGYCLIASPDGNIYLDSTVIANISDSLEDISRVISGKIGNVLKNKTMTYS